MPALRSALSVLLLMGCGTSLAVEMRASGFAQWEAVDVLGSPPAGLADGYREWPRIRLALSGLAGRADWKLEGDFVSEAVTDAYVRLPLAGGRLWLGQFKQPIYLDALISDLEPLLIAPGGNAPFAVGRKLGLQYQRGFEHGRWQVGAYGRDLESAGPESALVARVYGGRSWEGGRWHLGAASAYERDPDAPLRFRLRPEARSTLSHWLNGGNLAAERVQRHGLEFGLQQGAWLLQSEWQGLSARADGVSRSGRNAYLALAWTSHGAPRAYRDGLFVAPPRQAEGIGPVEWVLRYSQTELPRMSGGDIDQSVVAAGVNVQIAGGWRFQLNLSRARGDGAHEAELLGFRAQFAF